MGKKKNSAKKAVTIELGFRVASVVADDDEHGGVQTRVVRRTDADSGFVRDTRYHASSKTAAAASKRAPLGSATAAKAAIRYTAPYLRNDCGPDESERSYAAPLSSTSVGAGGVPPGDVSRYAKLLGLPVPGVQSEASILQNFQFLLRPPSCYDADSGCPLRRIDNLAARRGLLAASLVDDLASVCHGPGFDPHLPPHAEELAAACSIVPDAVRHHKRVPWTHVLAVVARRSGDDACCRVCLESPTVPRVTRCGHIFCLTCIARSMNAQRPLGGGYKSAQQMQAQQQRQKVADRPRTCPVCNAAIDLRDLRPLILLNTPAALSGEAPAAAAKVVALRECMRRVNGNAASSSRAEEALPKAAFSLAGRGAASAVVTVHGITGAEDDFVVPRCPRLGDGRSELLSGLDPYARYSYVGEGFPAALREAELAALQRALAAIDSDIAAEECAARMAFDDARQEEEARRAHATPKEIQSGGMPHSWSGRALFQPVSSETQPAFTFTPNAGYDDERAALRWACDHLLTKGYCTLGASYTQAGAGQMLNRLCAEEESARLRLRGKGQHHGPSHTSNGASLASAGRGEGAHDRLFWYQAVDGSPMYLHPLCVAMLRAEAARVGNCGDAAYSGELGEANSDDSDEGAANLRASAAAGLQSAESSSDVAQLLPRCLASVPVLDTVTVTQPPPPDRARRVGHFGDAIPPLSTYEICFADLTVGGVVDASVIERFRDPLLTVLRGLHGIASAKAAEDAADAAAREEAAAASASPAAMAAAGPDANEGSPQDDWMADLTEEERAWILSEQQQQKQQPQQQVFHEAKREFPSLPSTPPTAPTPAGCWGAGPRPLPADDHRFPALASAPLAHASQPCHHRDPQSPSLSAPVAACGGAAARTARDADDPRPRPEAVGGWRTVKKGEGFSPSDDHTKPKRKRRGGGHDVGFTEEEFERAFADVEGQLNCPADGNS